MNTFVISIEDRRDLLTMLEEYRPCLRSEVEQMSILRRNLGQAIIVPADRLAPTIVSMYSLVRVLDLGPRQEETYTLVHPQDASVGRRRISVLSPLGTAILGREQGAIIEIPLPVKTILFAIRQVQRRCRLQSR